MTSVYFLVRKLSGVQVVPVVGSIILLDPKYLCHICFILDDSVSTSIHLRMNFSRLKNGLVVLLICVCSVYKSMLLLPVSLSHTLYFPGAIFCALILCSVSEVIGGN